MGYGPVTIALANPETAPISIGVNELRAGATGGQIDKNTALVHVNSACNGPMETR